MSLGMFLLADIDRFMVKTKVPCTCLLIQVAEGHFLQDPTQALISLMHVPDALDYGDRYSPPPEGPAIFQGSLSLRYTQIVRIWGPHRDPRFTVEDPAFAFNIVPEVDPSLLHPPGHIRAFMNMKTTRKYELTV